MTTATAPSDTSRAASAKAGTRLAYAANDLRHALAVVAPAVGGRSSVPAMQHVLIEAGTLTATDGELRITATLVEDAPPTVPVLLPHDKLSRIASACGRDSEIRIDISQTSCTVRNRGGKWILPTCPADEFRTASDAKTAPVARLPGDQLARCLATTLPAADRGLASPSTQGVRLEVTDGVVWFVATNGRRMHVHEAEIDQAVDDCAVVIPSRAVAVLLRLAQDAKDNAVQLEAGRALLVATGAGRSLTTPLLAGAYPKWRSLIPAPADQPTRVFAGALLSATRSASITTSETSSGVTYSITREGIMLAGKSAEAGESAVACDIVEPGSPCSVMLSPGFVAEFLETIDPSEVVALEVVDAGSPVIIRAEDRLSLIAPLSP